VILAAWRVTLELSRRLERTRLAFLIVAVVALGALMNQGKTGGELVYEHGVGMPRTTGAAPQIGQQPDAEHDVGTHTER
jgi:uncharacterized membrane protein